jgi:hypothetical protein
MQLLIESGLGEERLFHAMKGVEARERKAYPKQIDSPPIHWAGEYAETAEKCKLPTELGEAYTRLNNFVEPRLKHHREHKPNRSVDRK